MAEPPEIPGAKDVVSWFGYWPSFHDAEVISITLDRSQQSRVVLHAFASSASSTQATDDQGFFLLTKHATLTFLFSGFLEDAEGVTTASIDSFNHQNVLMELGIRKIERGFQLDLFGIFGVQAHFLVSDLSVRLEPRLLPDKAAF